MERDDSENLILNRITPSGIYRSSSPLSVTNFTGPLVHLSLLSVVLPSHLSRYVLSKGNCRFRVQQQKAERLSKIKV